MKYGTNAVRMRQENEKAILSLINERPISRAEIARITGLTRAAVTIITDELMKKGYILEEHTNQAKVGRQPILLSFHGAAIYAIGINITRTGCIAGISDLNGKLLIEEQFFVDSPEAFFQTIKEVIEKQIEKTGIDREQIYGVGVVSPGPIDVQEQKILNPPNFNAWHQVSVGKRTKECLGFEIHFENVANASALAEMYFGSAKGTGNFMTLLVDEGIGSGIVLNSHLFEGINELGHTSICYDGIPCECGNRGCLEKYAAIPMLLDGTGFNSWKEVTDSENTEIIEREAEYLSAAITNANNMFALDRVILCGDLKIHSEKLIRHISELVNKRILYKKGLQICPGKVYSQSLIASSIVIHDFFTK